MVAVAVNVTGVPAQMVLPGVAAMAMEGTTVGVTVIVIPELTTGVVLAQVALLVIVTVITSPVARVALV